MGYQKYGTIVCIISFWFVSFPITYLLTFTFGIGLKGIFLGDPVGMVIYGGVYLYLIYSTDFEKLHHKIAKKIDISAKSKKDVNLQEISEELI